MGPGLQTKPGAAKTGSFWRGPSSWLREQNLGREYWVFFTAAFFFDAGFSVYFFLFNLYLMDCHFNDRAIGLIGGAMTFGTLVGMLPAGVLARRFGLRPLLVFCFVAAPLMNGLRVLWVWEPGQICLGFLAGLAMCSWGVCFLSAVPRLTTEKNRTSAFSLIFSVSIGTGILGGILCGYLRRWLGMIGIAMQPSEVKRLILLLACGIVFLGIVPAWRLRMPIQIEENSAVEPRPARGRWLRQWRINPFLLRFLPSMALWTVVLAAFTPFANIYLSRDLHIPMVRIGLIFSIVQVVQLCMGLLTPVIFRALGLVNGVMATQIVTAVALGCMAFARNGRLAVVLYLFFSAAQWMSSPGLYNLLMNKTPDGGRSTAAAMTMFCNSLAGSAATAGAGVLFTRFGYPHGLMAIAAVAIAAAVLFRFLVGSVDRPVAMQV